MEQNNRLIGGILIFLAMVFTFTGSAVAVDRNGDWHAASQEIAADRAQVKKEIRNTLMAVQNERKKLRQSAAAARKGVREAKKELAALRSRLEALQKEENGLIQALSEKKAEMNKIQSTVRDNAGMFIAASALYSETDLPENWNSRVASIAEGDAFPGQDDIDLLLACLMGAVESSKEVRRETAVIYGRDGNARSAQVVRAGTFQAMYAGNSEAGFLVFDVENNILKAAPYAPDPVEKDAIRAVAADGTGPMPMDISQGKLLKNPPEKKTLEQTLAQGGLFLWPILGLAVLGLFLILERVLYLSRVRANGKKAVDMDPGAQAKTPAEHVVQAVMAQGEEDLAEAMESRMEKAILAQLPPLERFLQTIKVFATVAPLLGLLGTVSGIIRTFQVITAYGNGDPRLLSTGISEALLTTEMGLMAAIPLLICHHFLNRRVAAIILDMEYAGMTLIADHARFREVQK